MNDLLPYITSYAIEEAAATNDYGQLQTLGCNLCLVSKICLPYGRRILHHHIDNRRTTNSVFLRHLHSLLSHPHLLPFVCECTYYLDGEANGEDALLLGSVLSSYNLREVERDAWDGDAEEALLGRQEARTVLCGSLPAERLRNLRFICDWHCRQSEIGFLTRCEDIRFLFLENALGFTDITPAASFSFPQLVELSLEHYSEDLLEVLLTASPNLIRLSINEDPPPSLSSTLQLSKITSLACPLRSNAIEDLTSLSTFICHFLALLHLRIFIRPLQEASGLDPPSLADSTKFLRALPASIESLTLNGTALKAIAYAILPLIAGEKRAALPNLGTLSIKWTDSDLDGFEALAEDWSRVAGVKVLRCCPNLDSFNLLKKETERTWDDYEPEEEHPNQEEAHQVSIGVVPAERLRRLHFTVYTLADQESWSNDVRLLCRCDKLQYLFLQSAFDFFGVSPDSFHLSHLTELELRNVNDELIEPLLTAAPNLTYLTFHQYSPLSVHDSSFKHGSLTTLTCHFRTTTRHIRGSIQLFFLSTLICCFPNLLHLQFSLHTYGEEFQPTTASRPGHHDLDRLLSSLPAKLRVFELLGTGLEPIAHAMTPIISATPRHLLNRLEMLSINFGDDEEGSNEWEALVDACQAAGVKMEGSLGILARKREAVV
ncbi:hypothetical protein P7C70_g7857, partial [Phenoliferia sp. Uapishka_3]